MKYFAARTANFWLMNSILLLCNKCTVPKFTEQFLVTTALGDNDELRNVNRNETESGKRRKRKTTKEDEEIQGEKWKKNDFPICRLN